jgi:hypothetical protein
MLGSLNKSTKKGKAKAVSSKPSGASTSTSTGDNGGAPTVFNDIPMRPLPLPDQESRSNSPAVRPGFAPVRGFADDGLARSESPAVEKIHIPMSVKRKAQGDAAGAAKKR